MAGYDESLHAGFESAPATKFYTSSWETGTLGLLEIVREPSKVPYRLRKEVAKQGL